MKLKKLLNIFPGTRFLTYPVGLLRCLQKKALLFGENNNPKTILPFTGVL